MRQNTRHVYRLMYQFVRILKYGHKAFVRPCRSFLKIIIGKITYDYDIDLFELEVPLDHIHVVVGAKLKVSRLK